MKNLEILFIALATGLTSCSDDNDSKSAKLAGTWEYSKEGSVINGQEVITDYLHTEGCSRDYIAINDATFADHQFSGADCIEEIETTPYTRNGNSITITLDGVTITGTKSQLANTTLKLKRSFDFEGSTFVLISVFTRR